MQSERMLMAALLCAGGLLLGTSAPVQAAEEVIGTFKVVKGEVTIAREGKSVPAKIGDEVRRNDRLQTGATGSVGVTFLDGTTISLGNDTEYEIDDFTYKPREKKVSFSSKMAKGTLHFVSGNISKLAPENVKISTPTGTLGVRGTRFLVKAE